MTITPWTLFSASEARLDAVRQRNGRVNAADVPQCVDGLCVVYTALEGGIRQAQAILGGFMGDSRKERNFKEN